MIYLERNAALTESWKATEKIRLDAMERLADSSAGLTFEPIEHRYFLGQREMKSVSSIVEHFAPFDAEKMAARAAVNPKHPLFGKTIEEIIGIWEENGRQAANAGTDVHAFGEACFLYMTGQEDMIGSDFYERIYPEGLMAISPKEISLARWWAEQDWNRFTPIAKETRLVNPELGYAGTFDLLLYDRFNTSFVQKDYKTNKDLEKWYGDMMSAPLTMLRSNDIGKYTLQQTLYTVELRNIGFPVSGNDLIWLKEENYIEVPLDMNYDKVITYAVKLYMENINKQQNENNN